MSFDEARFQDEDDEYRQFIAEKAFVNAA
jgi:hypothetical protein